MSHLPILIVADHATYRALLRPLVRLSDGLAEGRDCSGAMLRDAGLAESASRAARATTATGVVERLPADFNQSVCHRPENDLKVVCVRS